MSRKAPDCAAAREHTPPARALDWHTPLLPDPQHQALTLKGYQSDAALLREVLLPSGITAALNELTPRQAQLALGNRPSSA